MTLTLNLRDVKEDKSIPERFGVPGFKRWLLTFGDRTEKHLIPVSPWHWMLRDACATALAQS